MKPALKLTLARLTLVLVSSALVLGAAETWLRLKSPDPTFGAAQELPWLRNQGEREAPLFTVSSEMGFRPVLGNDVYDHHGTLTNDYPLAKSPNRSRLLFIGDSVTARGLIIEALREQYGDEAFEYWNAGVESFNTIQEVAYYRRFNAGIEPDHVILTFHPNDFQTTPVAMPDGEGGLIVYALNQPMTRINPWLFARSYLYRYFVARVLTPGGDPLAITDEVEASLRDFAAELEAEGIRFSVLLLPYLEPPARWKPHQRFRRQRALQIVQANGIRHFDLFPGLLRALRDDVEIQERAGDNWHPSLAVARYFAKDLDEAGLLHPLEKKTEPDGR